MSSIFPLSSKHLCANAEEDIGEHRRDEGGRRNLSTIGGHSSVLLSGLNSVIAFARYKKRDSYNLCSTMGFLSYFFFCENEGFF